VFQPYETLTKKEERLAYDEMEEEREEDEEEEEEREDMEIEEEEDNGETSLRSIEIPANPTNKDLLKNRK